MRLPPWVRWLGSMGWTAVATLGVGVAWGQGTPQTALHGNANASAPASQQAAQLIQQYRITYPITAKTCPQWLPAWQQALALLPALPAPGQSGGRREFALLSIAQCELALGQAQTAAQRLRLVLDGADAQQPTLLNSARVLLAPLYAKGQGVAQDRERALGLYLMSDLDDAQRREAAELVFAMNGSRTLFFQLLEQGQLPTNWLRAIELHQQSNHNRYQTVRLALRAIGAAATDEGQRRAYARWLKMASHGQTQPTASGTEADMQQYQALTRLLEIAGAGLAHWNGDTSLYPAAWALLRQADTPTAQQELRQLEEKFPFTVVDHTGAAWVAVDSKAQP